MGGRLMHEVDLHTSKYGVYMCVWVCVWVGGCVSKMYTV